MTPSNELVNEWLKVAEGLEQPRFIAFATLAAEWGAQQERDACAKVCEDEAKQYFTPVEIGALETAATIIRSRGEVKP